MSDGFIDLDAAERAEVDVAGLVDLAHAARAEESDDLVLAVEQRSGGETGLRSAHDRRLRIADRTRVGYRCGTKRVGLPPRQIPDADTRKTRVQHARRQYRPRERVEETRGAKVDDPEIRERMPHEDDHGARRTVKHPAEMDCRRKTGKRCRR